MNDLIYKFLNKYLENPDPQYAIMLRGKWGCGKTFFIKNWIKNQKAEENKDDIVLTPIYISLYGIKSIEEIRTLIDKELNPFFYSTKGKTLINSLKFVSKIAFKTNLDINGDGDKESLTATIDTLSLFKDKDIKGYKFLIFDDLERSNMDMKELLGFINYFVEHLNCHIVMIGDEDKISGISKIALDEFKEKTIGREFEIKADIDNAIDKFITEIPVHEYLEKMREFIVECFKCTHYNNLRLLRQSLYDFKEQLFEIDDNLIKEDNVFLKNLLGSFIAVYAEYNNKENRDLISNWDLEYEKSLIKDDNELKNKIQNLQNKYYTLSENGSINILKISNVEEIIKHIKTGYLIKNFITSNLTPKEDTSKTWEKFEYYWNMEDVEFESNCNKALDEINNMQNINIFDVGKNIFYLSLFNTKGFYKIPNIEEIKNKISKIISSSKDINELFKIKQNLLTGMSSGQEEIPLLEVFRKYIFNEVECISEKMKDEFQEILHNLNNDNVHKLLEIDYHVCPRNNQQYKYFPIFDNEDANYIFELISKINNKGRNMFAIFLHSHYDLGVIDSSGYRFKADIYFLMNLYKLVNDKIETLSTSIEQQSYIGLKENIIKSIYRCYGKANVIKCKSLSKGMYCIIKTEMFLKDNGDKIPADKKPGIEAALTQLKDAHKSGDVAAIDAAIENLNKVMQEASAQMYQGAQGAQAGPQQAGPQGGAQQTAQQNQGGDDKDNIQDADFEEIK